jgi:SPX domain protein involved in polyphosphate accumulation
MKFGRILRSKMIPEWSGFYLDYKTLKKLLTPYKLLNKCLNLNF